MFYSFGVFNQGWYFINSWFFRGKQNGETRGVKQNELAS